jgi:hypothetical protein
VFTDQPFYVKIFCFRWFWKYIHIIFGYFSLPKFYLTFKNVTLSEEVKKFSFLPCILEFT